MGLERSLKVEGSLRSSASEVKSDSTQGITCGIGGGQESGRLLRSGVYAAVNTDTCIHQTLANAETTADALASAAGTSLLLHEQLE